jgi:hypothetical protein
MGEMMKELKPIHNDAVYESALVRHLSILIENLHQELKRQIVLRCYCC